MAVSGVALTVEFGVWDVTNGTWKTGDQGNLTLRLVADGAAGTPAAAPAQVDATNKPGAYTIVLTGGENTGTDMSLGGKTATAGCVVIPAHWHNTAAAVLSAQGVADALKLAPTTGDPEAGSPNKHLDDLLTGQGTQATAADIAAITQAQRVRIIIPAMMERPDTGSKTYRLHIYSYNEQHEAEALDAAPVVTAENDQGADRSSGLGAVSNPATGHYQLDYTVASGHAIEGLLYKVAAVEGGETTNYAASSIVVDTTAVDFTSADRVLLAAAATEATLVIVAADVAGLDGASIPTPPTVEQIRTELEEVGGKLDAIFAKLPAVGSIGNAGATELATVDNVADAIKVVTDKLATMLEAVLGGSSRFTTSALSQGPGGETAVTIETVAVGVPTGPTLSAQETTWELRRGDTGAIPITLAGSGWTVATTDTVRITVKAADSAALDAAEDTGAVVGPSLLTRVDSTNLTWDRNGDVVDLATLSPDTQYRFDVERTTSAGLVDTLVVGTMRILRDVTRSAVTP